MLKIQIHVVFFLSNVAYHIKNLQIQGNKILIGIRCTKCFRGSSTDKYKCHKYWGTYITKDYGNL